MDDHALQPIAIKQQHAQRRKSSLNNGETKRDSNKENEVGEVFGYSHCNDIRVTQPAMSRTRPNAVRRHHLAASSGSHCARCPLNVPRGR